MSGIVDADFSVAISGYGLYSQNVFLKGGVVATFGNLGGWVINEDSITDPTDNIELNSTTGFISLGQLTSVDYDTTDAGIYMEKDGDILIKSGSTANQDYIKASSGGIELDSSTFKLKGGETLYIDSATPKIALGTDASTREATTASTGFYVDGAGAFGAWAAAGDYIRFASSKLELASTDFELAAGSLAISGNGTSSYIKLGTTTGVDDVTNAGTYIDNSGNLMSFGDADNYIQRSGTSLVMKSESFVLKGSTTLLLNTTTLALGDSASTLSLTVGTGVYANNSGHFKAGSTSQYVKWDGTNFSFASANSSLDTDGKLTTTSASIGGWDIDANGISKSNIALNSTTGYIKAGTLTDTSENTTNVGFYVNNAGEMLLKSGTSANTNYLRFAGNAMTMHSTAFNLVSTNFKIGSGTLSSVSGSIVISGGDNKIYLGDSITLDGANEKIYIGTGTYNNANTSFYVDGTGKMSLGNALTFDGSDLSIIGTVYANAGSFTGNISASSGNIGG